MHVALYRRDERLGCGRRVSDAVDGRAYVGDVLQPARDDEKGRVRRRTGAELVLPAAAIAKTNNLSAQQSLRPGQQLVIPRYVQGAHIPAAPKTVPAATPLGSNGVHVVPRDLFGIPIQVVAMTATRRWTRSAISAGRRLY